LKVEVERDYVQLRLEKGREVLVRDMGVWDEMSNTQVNPSPNFVFVLFFNYKRA